MSRKRKRPQESTILPAETIRPQQSANPRKRGGRRKRRRAPGVLDRVLDGRARPLEDAVLSFLPDPPPPSPSECRCRGAGCLGCRGRPHLVRDGDPPEHRELLRSIYCFVPPSAPPPPKLFHRVGWAQRKIVRNVMEGSQNSNVLCTGYEERSRFSSIGEALSTHAWDLLLERIGDHLMFFLLRVSLIFLPLTNGNYQQVTGPILSEILQGSVIKRQRMNYDEKIQMSSCSSVVQPSGTNCLAWSCNIKSKSRKRTRLFSWQRRGKLKKMTSQCCCFCTLDGSDNVAAEYQINRGQIFYNTLSYNSTFPEWHILNKVKPNNSGAAILMEHIFGVSSGLFQSCINDEDPCTNKSNCLYRRHLVLLKSLIRNAQHCDRKKLLLRHCPFPISEQCSNNENGSEVREEKSFSQVTYEKRLIHSQHSSSNRLPVSQRFSDIISETEELNERTPVVSDSKIDLAECYSSHRQVVSFIWAVIRNIVPLELFGDSSTWRALRSNISKFVTLLRFEKFTLSQCLHRLKTSKHPFASQVRISNCLCYKFLDDTGICNCVKNDSNKSRKVKVSLHDQLFRCWIGWLFSSVVVPIISTCFYVTERQFEKLQVFYYPKPVWRKLTNNVIICLEKQNYRLLDHESCTSVIKKRNFGFSKVRLLPQKNNVRIVANTKAPCKIQIHAQNKTRIFFVKSVNSSMKEMHAILRKIKYENPQALGASVFGYDDFYQKLYRYVRKMKDQLLMIPKLYIVVGDVAKAFDSIDQDKLVRVMEDIIPKDKYTLRSYTQVRPVKKRMRAFQDHVAYDHASCSNDIIKFEAATRLRSSSCVVIDQGDKKCIRNEELHHLLTENLKRNILKIGKNFYLQTIGISQGSSISPLLCSFYLGHLEKSVIFPFLEETGKQLNAASMNKELVLKSCMLTSSGSMAESSSNPHYIVKPKKDDASCSGSSVITDDVSSDTQHQCQEDNASVVCNNETLHKNLSSPSVLLVRWIDDFLFISTSKQQATSFFGRMERGFKKYNCEMNNKKFGLNFDVEQKSHLQNRVYTGVDNVQFLPWSGLHLNCQTLEIQADYTRYWGIPISSTITVDSNGCDLSSLKAKLCDFMRPKCHPLFYDSSINSSQTVSLNAYQAFLLCAMKFHCYVRSIADNTELRPDYLLEAIEQSFRFMYMLIKKQMRKMGDYFGINPVLELTKEEMAWLGLSAYICVLKKKQSRHKHLLSLLKFKISAFGRIYEASDSLKYAIDDSHSSVFKRIRF